MGGGDKRPFTAPASTFARHISECKGCRLCTGFGRQVPSRQRTEPSAAFGSGIREDALKMYLSPVHARATAGNNSAGPIYNMESSLGRQAESSRPSTAAYSFGTGMQRPKFGKSRCPGPGAYRLKPDLGKQFDSSKHSSSNAVFPVATKACTEKVYSGILSEQAFIGKESPGPQAYGARSTLGRQVLSQRRSPAEFHMRTGKRFDYGYMRQAKSSPGAGQYDQYGAIGKHASSQQPNAASGVLGCATRDQMSKLYLSPEHDKQGAGASTPGPNTAEQYSSLGRQRRSLHSTAAKWSFSQTPRLPSRGASNNPGPGSYCV